MKKITPLAAAGIFLFLLSGCCSTETNPDYCKYVNPFIGTGGHGHTFPGPVVPYGMIQPSPDTRIYQWDACSGYHYSDTTINGFSHTHLSGTGCGDYGDVLLMPTVGAQEYHSLGSVSQQMAYASSFSHTNETASPGYYSVLLDRYDVKAELTATKRAAIHRYTFPQTDEAGFILDLDYSLQRQKNDLMLLEVVSDTEIRGRKKTAHWAFDQYISFYAKFSKPFTCQLVADSASLDPDSPKLPQAKALLRFKTNRDEQVFVKVGISAVDMQGAQQNVEAEIPGWDFEAVKREANDRWNAHLSKIKIKTADEVQKNIFYTALYHTAISPNLFADTDGRYRGMDQQIHQGSVTDPLYTVFSLWDTYRGFHPLLSIVDPELNNAFVRSLILKHKEGGLLPMWDLASNYTATMIGYHAVPVLVDAYMKGERDFDVAAAYEACLKVANYDTTGIVCPPAVLPHLVPKSKYYKNELGYIPCDIEHESVAKAMEYAYNDWCVSAFAEKLGDKENALKFASLAKSYERYFDPETRFMRGVDSNGAWRTPFHPRSSSHRNDDYCEGTAWQWTWSVQHDVPGLIQLMGGKDGFIAKLDSLFTEESALEGENTSVDISGLIGQYAHGNEPSHHIIHLYNYVDQPYKTQQLVDSVLYGQYSDQVDGLSGNEDCGQMSAWYILNAMGFYQVCPGNPVYSLGRPLFDEVVIPLRDGREFKIVVNNNSKENKYIRSASMNGKTLSEPFFNHDDIMKGGLLEITMSDQPTKWSL